MNKTPIHILQKQLESGQFDEGVVDLLRSDSRKGVQRLIAQYDKKRQIEKRLAEEVQNKLAFDDQFRLRDDCYLAGIDEAGRGPLAGPVVAAAVILPRDFKPLGLNDSKQMTEKDRSLLFEAIIKHAISYSISTLSAQHIDELNIFQATKQVMGNALNSLHRHPEVALIDAVKLSDFPFSTHAIIKGDEKSLAIAAASVLAKVTRDKIMVDLHDMYPEYDFKQNKGYGTKKHLLALKKYGPTEHHRKSFSPVQNTYEKMS
ncbi:ribonuclease HII [Pseudogracilibacillus sp. SE30717A]|uniref:ribonuclease HII n=1 Tax=Pseudogracilibacillus sp. SE30717A TaxID=3098293 RepID=UPI00300E4084